MLMKMDIYWDFVELSLKYAMIDITSDVRWNAIDLMDLEFKMERSLLSGVPVTFLIHLERIDVPSKFQNLERNPGTHVPGARSSKSLPTNKVYTSKLSGFNKFLISRKNISFIARIPEKKPRKCQIIEVLYKNRG